jgi:hypothetical protein
MKRRTAFFVEEREAGQNQPTDTFDQPERLDLELIAIGKRIGLSFIEMNEFSVRDLLSYSDIYMGKKEKKARMATQEDIDRFFAG